MENQEFSYLQSYSEKLEDPRWQKVRLKIFERDGWKCLDCGDEKTMLIVHHKEYTTKDPWDEDPKNLKTICKNCHDNGHGINLITLLMEKMKNGK